MYQITKSFNFSASHRLDSLPSGHKCKRLHGHNYIVEVVLETDVLDEYGFVVDFGDLKHFKDFIDEKLDHQHLNDVLEFETTAENLAKYLFVWAKHRWPQTVAMRVSETPKTWAVFTQ